MKWKARGGNRWRRNNWRFRKLLRTIERLEKRVGYLYWSQKLPSPKRRSDMFSGDRARLPFGYRKF